MEIPYEIVSVLRGQRHEGSSLNNELDFVCGVTYFFQLFDSVLDLYIRVVSCSDGSHAGWLVSCIRLGGVFEV